MLQFSQRKKREGKNKEKAETNGSPYIPLPITGEHSRAKKKDWGKFVLGPLKTAASYRKLLIGESLVSLLKHKRKDQMEQRVRYGKYYIESNFVCTKANGEPVTPNSVKYHAEKVQDKLGFPFDFHSLRHTHATMLLENGANIKEIQARLGHARISTTMDTYSHVTEKMSSETVDIFEKMVLHQKN